MITATAVGVAWLLALGLALGLLALGLFVGIVGLLLAALSRSGGQNA